MHSARKRRSCFSMYVYANVKKKVDQHYINDVTGQTGQFKQSGQICVLLSKV